jgi:hypothetical protein
MIKKLNITLAVAAMLCMAAYGVAQVAGSGSRGESQNSPQSPRGMMDAAGRERAALVQIRLSPDQLARLDRINKEVAAEYFKVRDIPKEEDRIARGVAIALERIQAMKRLMTTAQYEKYDNWINKNIEIKHSSDPVGARETEIAILKSLNLSKDQWDKVEILWPKLASENYFFYRLVETDSMGAGWYSHIVNKVSVEGMRAILTPKQFESYSTKWREVFGISN